MLAATGLSVDHQLNIWDSVASCSEDFQDGFTWNGVTVTDPFSASRHPLLEALIAGPVE